MKKLIFAAVLAASASVFAAENGITSANIVGYTRMAVEQGVFEIIAAQFEDMAGTTKLNSLISGVEGVDFDSGLLFKKTAAQIQIPDGSGYTTYYYLNDAWYADGSSGGATKPGWADMGGNLVDIDVTPGVAMWFKCPTSVATPTVAGAVSGDAQKSIDCPIGFALRANTYPIAITLNGTQMTSADLVGVDFDYGLLFKKTAAQLQVPAGTGYTTYYYLNDAWYADGTTSGATKPGWADAKGDLVSETIPAMQGFWTKGVSGAFTLTFNK
jgi:hypothetical protein